MYLSFFLVAGASGDKGIPGLMRPFLPSRNECEADGGDHGIAALTTTSQTIKVDETLLSAARPPPSAPHTPTAHTTTCLPAAAFRVRMLLLRDAVEVAVAAVVTVTVVLAVAAVAVGLAHRRRGPDPTSANLTAVLVPPQGEPGSSSATPAATPAAPSPASSPSSYRDRYRELLLGPPVRAVSASEPALADSAPRPWTQQLRRRASAASPAAGALGAPAPSSPAPADTAAKRALSLPRALRNVSVTFGAPSNNTNDTAGANRGQAIGVVLRSCSNHAMVEIDRVVPGLPGWFAGLRPGDRVVGAQVAWPAGGPDSLLGHRGSADMAAAAAAAIGSVDAARALLSAEASRAQASGAALDIVVLRRASVATMACGA